MVIHQPPSGPGPQRKPGIDHTRIQRPEFKKFGYSSALVPHSPPARLKSSFAWQKRPDLTIKLRGVHPATTTYRLFLNFQKYGNIVLIEIFQDRTGARDGGAKVRFSPPPSEAFWMKSEFFMLNSEDGKDTYNVRITMEEPRSKIFQVQSPIRKSVFYDPKMTLFAQTLQFGLMIDPRSIMPMYMAKPLERRDGFFPRDDLSFVVDLVRRRVVGNFKVDFRDPRRTGPTDYVSTSGVGQYERINKYMFQIPFDQLKNIYRVALDNQAFALVISLESPPGFYRKREDEKACHSDEGVLYTEFDTWYRSTDIVYDPFRLQTAVITLHKEKPIIDIGRWKTYVFIFEPGQDTFRVYNQMKQALQDFNIEIIDVERHRLVQPQKAELWSLIDPPQLLHGAAGLVLPFEVRYQLEVCISREIINEHNINRDFVKTLAELASTDSIKAKNLLEYVAGQEKLVYDPMTIFADEDALAFAPKSEIPHYCAYSRKATITPTTIYFSSPTVETTNRVLRHYARENSDGRFLRVQFTDEMEEGRINSCADKQRNDELYTRVYRTLFNGIRIGDRHYEFLAFGNSQFRENGAYFFCPTNYLSCDDIRNWMGNFSHIKVVARYAARLGQCFSTTRAINGLSKPDIVKIPDIEGNGCCFTDGVGKISPFLAQMISAELGLRVSTPPSAFQFRLGGCKGVLTVWPDAKDREVHIRRSQQKFTATYNGLEIIRWSRFSACTLNRQTITILSSLGVADGIFLQMLTEQLANYQTAMTDIELAVSLLSRYIDDNHMTINIASMINNGFMTEREPFVLSLLHLWRSWSIKLLKEKAKIIVEDGAFVLGCVDETGTLQGYTKPTVAHGGSFTKEQLPQIFIQIPSKDDANRYNVVEGVCLVGRNPSLHPGDLRVVHAVDIPALRHLRDVVVFPQNGVRDIPSMCSGGDLDGDDFFVIWDKALQPTETNCEPMNYSPPTQKTHRGPIKVTDLMKFFVRYMKNDALPTIAHAHMAQSDALPHGIKDPKCLELATLHSKAVDYVKTGQPAEMPKRLRPFQWPHFMEKKHKTSYHSHKILGQLFDKVESVDFVPQWEQPFDKRILRAYKLDNLVLKNARQVKSEYDTHMRRIMAQQEIMTEFEVWSTFVLSKPRVGSDYKVQEIMAGISDGLKDQFRTACIERAGGKDFSLLGPFVAAMYKVTKEELDIALAECRSTKMVGGREVPKRKMEQKSMPLISFPWLFEKELGRIATGVEIEDDISGLGLLPLVVKKDGVQPRKRAGGNARDLEDYIQQEDGVIVHRGEELDLFRPDPESDEFSAESDYDEAHSHLMGENGEAVSDTAFQASSARGYLLGGTGLEDVVPRPKLDGFIDPRDYAPPEPEFGGLSLPNVSAPTGWLSGPFTDLKPAHSVDNNQPAPFSGLDGPLAEKSGPEAEQELFEDDDVDVNAEGWSGPEAREQTTGEEEVKLDVKESPLERLARMMGS